MPGCFWYALTAVHCLLFFATASIESLSNYSLAAIQTAALHFVPNLLASFSHGLYTIKKILLEKRKVCNVINIVFCVNVANLSNILKLALALFS